MSPPTSSPCLTPSPSLTAWTTKPLLKRPRRQMSTQVRAQCGLATLLLRRLTICTGLARPPASLGGKGAPAGLAAAALDRRARWSPQQKALAQTSTCVQPALSMFSMAACTARPMGAVAPLCLAVATRTSVRPAAAARLRSCLLSCHSSLSASAAPRAAGKAGQAGARLPSVAASPTWLQLPAPLLVLEQAALLLVGVCCLLALAWQLIDYRQSPVYKVRAQQPVHAIWPLPVRLGSAPPGRAFVVWWSRQQQAQPCTQPALCGGGGAQLQPPACLHPAPAPPSNRRRPICGTTRCRPPTGRRRWRPSSCRRRGCTCGSDPVLGLHLLFSVRHCMRAAHSHFPKHDQPAPHLPRLLRAGCLAVCTHPDGHAARVAARGGGGVVGAGAGRVPAWAAAQPRAIQAPLSERTCLHCASPPSRTSIYS